MLAFHEKQQRFIVLCSLHSTSPALRGSVTVEDTDWRLYSGISSNLEFTHGALEDEIDTFRRVQTSFSCLLLCLFSLNPPPPPFLSVMNTLAPPSQRSCFIGAAFLTRLTSLLHFTRCTSPFFKAFFYFFFIFLKPFYSGLSVHPHSLALPRLLCQEMNATQSGTRKWLTRTHIHGHKS